jgi:hypothetical protein
MELEQLMGRYFRLKQELAVAYQMHPWRSGRINRLANEIAVTEREIAAHQSTNRTTPSELRSVA